MELSCWRALCVLKGLVWDWLGLALGCPFNLWEEGWGEVPERSSRLQFCPVWIEIPWKFWRDPWLLCQHLHSWCCRGVYSACGILSERLRSGKTWCLLQWVFAYMLHWWGFFVVGGHYCSVQGRQPLLWISWHFDCPLLCGCEQGFWLLPTAKYAEYKKFLVALL